MFFADDCYIFCKASMDSANDVSDLLRVFEKASGQQINMDKSSVFFSRNTSSQLKQELCNHLRVKEVDNNSFYLGLPIMINRKKLVVLVLLRKSCRSSFKVGIKNSLQRVAKFF